MDVPQTQLVYTISDFGSLGFHDCHVHAIRWASSTCSLILDLDYILSWIDTDGHYRFLVAPAELTFAYASDVKVSLDWTKMAMECQIQDISRVDCRVSPNGSEVYRWQIDFSTPDGSIELWSSDFRMELQGSPTLSETQRLRGGGVTLR